MQLLSKNVICSRKYCQLEGNVCAACFTTVFTFCRFCCFIVEIFVYILAVTQLLCFWRNFIWSLLRFCSHIITCLFSFNHSLCSFYRNSIFSTEQLDLWSKRWSKVWLNKNGEPPMVVDQYDSVNVIVYIVYIHRISLQNKATHPRNIIIIMWPKVQDVFCVNILVFVC